MKWAHLLGARDVYSASERARVLIWVGWSANKWACGCFGVYMRMSGKMARRPDKWTHEGILGAG